MDAATAWSNQKRQPVKITISKPAALKMAELLTGAETALTLMLTPNARLDAAFTEMTSTPRIFAAISQAKDATIGD